jgi:hypothetical protein
MTYCKLDPFTLSATQPITGPTPFTQSTWFADPNLKRLYSDRWNFGVQQQGTPKAVLTANYVESVGHKLDIGGAYNVCLQPGPIPTNCSAAAINCGAPFDYIGATSYDPSVGKSNYQALPMS